MSDFDNEINYIDNKINELVKQNEFYDYKEILEKLNNLLIQMPQQKLLSFFLINNDVKDKSIEIIVNCIHNYNIILHHFSYVIYNNATDGEYIVKIAKEIYRMSGCIGLDIAYYILCNISPYANNEYGKIQIKTIQYYFDLVKRTNDILNN